MEGTMLSFSEREKGERPRDNDEINEEVWGGLQALIHAGVHDGSFGNSYPTLCPNGYGRCGTDVNMLWQAMRAEIPELQETSFYKGNEPWFSDIKPPIPTILDIIEFCWRHIGKPWPVGGYDDFCDDHPHLEFDVNAGRESFREAVNDIFRRNGIAYELRKDGRIERLGPLILREELRSACFSTGDSKLDCMLESARLKFLDKNEATRREALNVLWDAWERLKTLCPGSDKNKKEQIKALLDATAGSSSSKFREVLEQDAQALTKIGNTLQIRHSEVKQESIANNEHVDYLFHRLFALVLLILRRAPMS